MKQIFRFFFSPATFVNQLQWSRNHTLILFTFLGVAFVEGHVGFGRELNQQLAWLVSQRVGMDQDMALLAVTAARVLFLFIGAVSLSETLWWLGATFGRHTSKRVLYRRLAIVLTLLLGAYTLHASGSAEALPWAWALSGWGLVLSYLTLREQFMLNRLMAAALGLIAVSGIVMSWQVTDRMAQQATGHAIAEQVAKAPRH